MDCLIGLGNGFTVQEGKALLIGGGLGTPPLYNLGKKLKEKGSEAPEALVAKITEFKTALDGIRGQMTALNNADLEAAYQRGRA